MVNEPFHIHISDDANKLCKYWIFENQHFELADHVGFNKKELRKIEQILAESMNEICNQYEYYCNTNHIAPNYKIRKAP
ncbi:DUF4160 domain-containing protein [Runella sp.]|uniref:DUF4160 domain-containing protein n=1 Tax=Runella sp. TaxID=1960881 RepID=UPI003D11A5A1